MRIMTLDAIKEKLKQVNLTSFIEQGFIAYSQGRAIVPPVGELVFKNPPGDVHIKYGYLVDDDYYVIKVASGFYDNPKLGLPSSQGLMLLFDQKTGVLLAILNDEGFLTDIRTAVAGAIVAKYLAPRVINKIGIVGTGTQARAQLEFLKTITLCKEVVVFGRSVDNLLKFQCDMQNAGFNIQITQTIEELTASCNFIVTTTASTSPVLFAKQIKKGTHITAVGADTPHKQELDDAIFSMADVIVTDSVSQCIERGDIAHAIRNKIIKRDQLIELGNIISGECKGRVHDEQITVADLTGLAVQDIQIAKAVYES